MHYIFGQNFLTQKWILLYSNIKYKDFYTQIQDLSSAKQHIFGRTEGKHSNGFTTAVWICIQ